MYNNVYVNEWVEQMAKMTQPDSIVWIDGSEEERERLTKQALSTGEMIELDQEKLPGCLYHRTAENDVARVEHLTFICTEHKEDAGPINNWMEKSAAYAKLGTLFEGSMKGRTMYVIPYIMGPAFSEFSKVGIEITDSIYVVLNMRIMTRMGKIAMDMLGDSPNFIKGLHSKGEIDPEKRYICHFPEDNAIWSIGSGYGGNVLLGKKCFALRIASWLGRKEGWMAEHMLILGVQYPNGDVKYISAAFPSACGKTNLAMLIPPKFLSEQGYEVECAYDGAAAVELARDGVFDLLILDVMMPEVDGLEACMRIREFSNVPIIMLTAKSEVFDRIQGLEMGADDYIVKPFSPREVLARIKAVLRRFSEKTGEEDSSIIRLPQLEISLENYQVKAAGKVIPCTPKEVEILHMLTSNVGQVFSREQILSRVWGYDYFGDTRTVDAHIKRIRQKLPTENVPWALKTVYGVGYRFEVNA